MTIEDAFMRVFGDLIRQGPGTTASTLRALNIVRPLLPPSGEVLDVGCGTGASTRVLARHLDRVIRASDVFPASIEIARKRAELVGLGDRIVFEVASLDDPGIGPDTAALIWCEAAAYSVGVGRALDAWRDLLMPGGLAVFSELVWLGEERPPEAFAFWEREYPGMTDVTALRAEVTGRGLRAGRRLRAAGRGLVGELLSAAGGPARRAGHRAGPGAGRGCRPDPPRDRGIPRPWRHIRLHHHGSPQAGAVSTAR